MRFRQVAVVLVLPSLLSCSWTTSFVVVDSTKEAIRETYGVRPLLTIPAVTASAALSKSATPWRELNVSAARPDSDLLTIALGPDSALLVAESRNGRSGAGEITYLKIITRGGERLYTGDEVSKAFVERSRMLPHALGARGVLTVLALVALLVVPAQITDSITRYVESELQRQHIPGASVAVLQGNRVVLARGFGLANVELHVPASDSTIYQSGSVGKQFTAALVEMLVGEGRVHLDDTITRWFPEGARVWNEITVRHLLTHTSGVAEYTDSTFDARKDYSEDELVRLAAARPLDFRPGERWSYSNTGYLLLGALIRRVTGRFYGDLLRDSVFQPLGMRDSRVISEADIVPNRAAGYRLEDGDLKNQEWVAPSLNTTADGALYFTVRDLIKWAVALNEGRAPSRAALDTAWTPVRLADGATYPYGFAWYLNDQRGHARISHTGAWQGFKTVIARYPEYGITVIVFANLAEARVGAIAYGIAGMLEPALEPPHLMGARTGAGRMPPRPIPDLLRLIVADSDSSRITARFARFLTPADREDYRPLVDASRQWTPLGCDAVGSRRMSRLGANVAFVCHARAARTVGGTAVSVLYTSDWRVAGIDSYQY